MTPRAHLECVNCGLSDVPLTGGYCEECTCDRCGVHGTMSEFGWCQACGRAVEEEAECEWA